MDNHELGSTIAWMIGHSIPVDPRPLDRDLALRVALREAAEERRAPSLFQRARSAAQGFRSQPGAPNSKVCQDCSPA